MYTTLLSGIDCYQGRETAGGMRRWQSPAQVEPAPCSRQGSLPA